MTVIATKLVVVDAVSPVMPTVTAKTTGGAAYIQSGSPANWVNMGCCVHS